MTFGIVLILMCDLVTHKGYDVLVTKQDFPVCMCFQSAANQSTVSPLWLELRADGTLRLLYCLHVRLNGGHPTWSQ